jgi:hypothetical protein
MDNFTTYKRYINNVNVWKRKKWLENDSSRRKNINYCHFGQLKLFFSELEFLTICCKNEFYNATVIYVGAAPGTHLILLQQFFPHLHWILYDPNPFHIKKNDKVDIINEYFTDESITKILNHKFVKNTEFKLFISDIRVSTNENQVFNDMISQQRWLLQLQSDMSMLKFRLPYTLSEGRTNWEYSMEDIQGYVNLPKKMIKKDYILYYLSGRVYTQIYPPNHSTETRLIIKNYNIKPYNTTQYEEQCYYYNTHIRHLYMTYKDSELLKHHIVGMFDNYETCSQYHIVEEYLQLNNTKSSVNILNILYDIYSFYNTLTIKVNNTIVSKTLIICPLLSILKKRIISVEHFQKYIREKKLTNVDINDIKHIILQIYDDIIIYTNNQIKYISDSSLLTNEMYKTQLRLLEKSKYHNKVILDSIITIFNRIGE